MGLKKTFPLISSLQVYLQNFQVMFVYIKVIGPRSTDRSKKREMSTRHDQMSETDMAQCDCNCSDDKSVSVIHGSHGIGRRREHADFFLLAGVADLAHLDEQFLQFSGLGFVLLGPFHCA